MSRLIVLPRHRVAIHGHAAATYPEECCGVLIGRALPDGGGGLVEKVLPVDNARRESRDNRYLIDPETVLAAEKEARAARLEVLGYYHSHPDHPARPSEFDREHAWPGLSYVIVAVEDGEVADVRSWRLSEDRDGFREQTLSDEVPIPAAVRNAAGSRAQRSKEER